MSRIVPYLRLRFRSLFRRSAVAHEIHDELQAHQDQEVLDLMEAGWPMREARMEARRRFGNSEQIYDRCSDLYMVRGSGWMLSLGDVKGADVVQLYINDIISSMVTPLIELKGFRKLELAPGETRTIEFILGPKELSLWNGEMTRVVEPGEFSIMIGRSCKNIVLQDTLEVTE